MTIITTQIKRRNPTFLLGGGGKRRKIDQNCLHAPRSPRYFGKGSLKQKLEILLKIAWRAWSVEAKLGKTRDFTP